MELIKNNVKIELEDIGEGLIGEYDENDSEDISLLRFYVSENINNEWEDVLDGSYCTNLPSSITAEQETKALELLMKQFYESVTNGKSIKKIGEIMSWISLEWLENDSWKKKYNVYGGFVELQ